MWSEINHYNDLSVEFYVSYCKNLLNEKKLYKSITITSVNVNNGMKLWSLNKFSSGFYEDQFLVLLMFLLYKIMEAF